jgi:predicted helicase
LLSNELDSDFVTTYNIKDSSSYGLLKKIQERFFDDTLITNVHFRPFDTKYIYYDKDLIGRAFYNVMKHVKMPQNLTLIVSRGYLSKAGQIVTDFMNVLSCIFHRREEMRAHRERISIIVYTPFQS